MHFRHGFDEAENAAVRARTALYCLDESRAIQSQAEDADINVLVRRFGVTGLMSQNYVQPNYIESDEVFDYQEARNLLIEASRNFMLIPAELRREFDNDPIRFVEFAQDEKNLPRLREMGLAKPVEAPPPPVEVRVIPDAPPSS